MLLLSTKDLALASVAIGLHPQCCMRDHDSSPSSSHAMTDVMRAVEHRNTDMEVMKSRSSAVKDTVPQHALLPGHGTWAVAM